ncbi:MAG: M15 family metallopeptidase, partial [Deltaproteobacteria bacterium]|nr:M15 family metallopeptidase [Deltaproteobacteria bacterium]
MNLRMCMFNCSAIIMMVFLMGCSATPHRTSEVSSVRIEQQIRLLTAATHKVIGEVQTPEGFYAIATTLPLAVEKQMRLTKSWKQGCPVGLSDLNYVVVTHWGFDGHVKVGELVVHRKLALPVMNTFADLFTTHYPIEKMELIENYDASDDRSMAANNSSAFNCRDITGKPGIFSKHSYGGAIDINPLQNPYVAPKSDSLRAMGWDNVENKGAFLRRNGYDAPSPALKFCTERPTDCFVLPPAAAEYA